MNTFPTSLFFLTSLNVGKVKNTFLTSLKYFSYIPEWWQSYEYLPYISECRQYFS